MENLYGFFNLEDDNGVITPALITGDGKTVFFSEHYSDKTAALCFSYGANNINPWTSGKFPEGTTGEDIEVDFKIIFESLESVDALVKALGNLGEKLKEDLEAETHFINDVP